MKPWVIGIIAAFWLFLGYQPNGQVLAQLATTSSTHSQMASAKETSVPLQKFVSRYYPQGVPFVEAREYESNKSEVDKLIVEHFSGENGYCMTTMGFKCSNVIVTLGIIGNPEAVDKLIEFVERPLDIKEEKYISWPQVRAKRTALISLGYVINKHEKSKQDKEKIAADKAIQFLCKFLGDDHDFISEEDGCKKMSLPIEWSDMEIDLGIKSYLEKAACLGLAFSGSKLGNAVLTEQEGEFVLANGFRSFSNWLPDFLQGGKISKFISAVAEISEPDNLSRDFIREARNAHNVTQKGQNGLISYYNSAYDDEK